MNPKVFISYSWSSPGHQSRIRQWAEQLINDGVDVILDVWDLKEGDDKYAFMERMVTDESVTHVLVFSDFEYMRKADSRNAGVGTESQIISQEVYSKVKQSKFIPIVCEVGEDGEPALPTFLKSRIWINFSTPEAANENWERLIRLLHGKPELQKPTVGKPPAYISADISLPASPAIGKYNALRQAVLQKKPGIRIYRQDFLETCFAYADQLRVRKPLAADSFGPKVLEDCGMLKIIRDHLTDWVMLESNARADPAVTEALLDALERLVSLKFRPADLTIWDDAWFEAHRVFVYETFLYVIAALLKTDSFDILHEVLVSNYILPATAGDGKQSFSNFKIFWGYAKALQTVLAPEGRRLLAPAAELIKRQADRPDIRFTDVMQAELMVLLMALIGSSDQRWYPQTLLYSEHSRDFPLFVRAAQHKHFLKIATVTGISDADELRKAVKEGQERQNVASWSDFGFFGPSFWDLLNMDAMDTVK